MVTSNTGVSSLSILTNRTAAGETTVSFERLDLTIPAVGNDAGAGPTNPVAADFNNDGKPDVVSANWKRAGSDVPSLAFVEIVDLPARMQEVTFFEWLEGKSDGQSPGVWFTSTGNAADFDGDGSLDITIAVAHGNFAIEMQGRLSKTDDIIDFVQPPISLEIAKQFLPKHTELIHYVK